MDPLNPPASAVSTPVISSPPETLNKPRILCLHGAGVNANVFAMQMRMLIPALSPFFRLVFVDGPYLSEMHPALAIVYDDLGPYYRWAGWLPGHEERDFGLVVSELEDRLSATMRADQGTGEWVGILGFSQGAKLAVSVLVENQIRREEERKTGEGQGKKGEKEEGEDENGGYAGAWWKFGVIMAGRARPYALSRGTKEDKFFVVPGDGPLRSNLLGETEGFGEERKLKTPSLHVHGLQDPGLEEHRVLMSDFCTEDSRVLIEWNDGHRLPFRSWDVKAVVDGILKVAKMGGVNVWDVQC